MRTISVVTPTFNDAPEHLRECIASVQNQSVSVIEHIIVDDGSTSPATQEFLAGLSGAKVIRQANAGPSAARNRGISAAVGELIVTLDGDDFFDPQFVEEALDVIEEPDTIIAHASFRMFGECSDFYPAMREVRLIDLMDGNKISSAAMFRKDSWEAVGGYLESFRDGMEDYEFWVRLLRDGGVARAVPTAETHYRVRAGSRAQSAGSDYRRVTREAIVEANRGHEAPLLAAALERIEQLSDRLREEKAYSASWRRRMAVPIAVVDGARRLGRMVR